MFCNKCGKEVNEEAVVCVHCGCSLKDDALTKKEETSTLGVLSIVFGALGGWLGLVFAITGLCIYKKPENKRKCYVGLGLFCGWIVILLILTTCM